MEQLSLEEMRANKVGCVSVSNCLTRFAETHWVGHHSPGVNLNRKMWHSAIKKVQGRDEAFKALCKIDTHATKTGKAVYCPTDPEEDAATGFHLYKFLFKEHVTWPSAEQAAVRDHLLDGFLNRESCQEEDAHNPEIDPQSEDEEHNLDEIDAALDAMLVPFIEDRHDDPTETASDPAPAPTQSPPMIAIEDVPGEVAEPMNMDVIPKARPVQPAIDQIDVECSQFTACESETRAELLGGGMLLLRHTLSKQLSVQLMWSVSNLHYHW